MPDPLPPLVASALERHLPPKTDYGIAFVGCGGIVNYGHIPAYKASGFHMLGGYDLNRDAAEQTVKTHGLSKVYGSLDEVLADPAVQIVDIAALPWVQLGIVEKVVAAKKHMLCQKPFADKYAEAVKMVERARAADLKIAAHQQFRCWQGRWA